MKNLAEFLLHETSKQTHETWVWGANKDCGEIF